MLYNRKAKLPSNVFLFKSLIFPYLIPIMAAKESDIINISIDDIATISVHIEHIRQKEIIMYVALMKLLLSLLVSRIISVNGGDLWTSKGFSRAFFFTVSAK